MSPRRANLRYTHKIDVYTKTTVTNDVGQKKPTWTLTTAGQSCYFTPSGSASSVRVIPTAEEADYYTIIFPHDADITYQSRLENVTTKLGEEVYSGELQIIQIDVHVSFTGRRQFLQVKVKSVIEQQ